MDDDNSIVIVGVGCKFPGADNLDEFWRVLSEGENHVIEVPRERWNLNAFYDKDPDEPGKTYVRHAGLIKRYDEWDHKFFGINEVEGARMDPQQRYVLDCVHMAMEDGGITKKELNGSNTGVYIGVMNDDYKGGSSEDFKTMNNYTLTGTASSIISARVSYTYNLLGPSMSIDTACSSALVAIHIASQSLKGGECNTVICGGVNSIMYPDIFVPLSKARMVSPTGQCKTFSNKADGYTRGEGCGIVILKTKKQALKDGNKIWATIATACNQDGRTMTPITAPSGVQQLNLLHRLYTDQGVNPKDVSYIEAHGTGTPLGDPVEANALGQFFGEKHSEEQCQEKVFLGSVKTNIGHLESAAGVAGLIKVLLMMDNGKIVPSLHFGNPNPNIDFEKYRLVIPQKTFPWPCHLEGRLSCVNSFGFGGTNSHAIIKQYSCLSSKKPVRPHEDSIITISGNDMTSLEKSLLHLRRNIHKGKYCIEDVSYTSTCRRDHYPYRVAIQASTKDDVIRKCDEELHKLDSIQAVGFSKPNVIFVFCGVGTTWKGMCQELLRRPGVFQDTVKSIDSILTPLAAWSIFKAMADGFDVHDPLKSHLAIFTCQVALTKLWNHFGIYPDCIVGQSVGEVAAAHTAGILTLEDAVNVIYQRSVILAKATGGTMVVIGNCLVSTVANACKRLEGKVNIAVQSSSKACTLSGDADAIEEVINILDKRCKDKLFIRRLDVKCAYHSHHMTAASEELKNKLVGLNGLESKCTLISTVTGQKASSQDFISPEYWKKNVRQQVLFHHAITEAHAEKAFNIYLEIGPKPILRFHLGDIVGTQNAIALPSIIEKKEWEMMQLSLMGLYKHGIDPHWLYAVTNGNLTNIPKHSFNPVKLLFQSEATTLKYDGVKSTGPSHLFVERAAERGVDGIRFNINISPTKTWFVYQHIVSGMIVSPGALYIDVAIEIGKTLFKNKKLEDLSISAQFVQPLSVRNDESCTAKAHVEKSEDELSIRILKNNETIAKCQIRKTKTNALDTVNLETIRRRCKIHQTASQTYKNLKALGFSYGKDLQILMDSVKNDIECLVNVTVSDSVFKDTSCTHLHPSICDGILQTFGVLDVKVKAGTTLLPGGIESVVIRRAPEKKMIVFTSLTSQAKDKIRCNALLLTEDGRVVAEIKNFFILCVGATNMDENQYMLQVQWEEIEKKGANIVERAHLETPFNSIVVSRQPDNAESLALEIKEMSFFHISLQDKHFEETFSDHLQKAMSVIQSILFLVEKGENLEKMTGEDVMERVAENTSVFLKVCQHLTKIEKEIPILIITEQTQSMDTTQNCVKNVIGSELWGMARTIVLEYPLQITLIDRYVSLKICCSIIRDIVVFKSPQFCSESELLIIGNHVYANRVVGLQDQPGKYRWISLKTSDHVRIRAYCPDDVREKFCMLQDPENKANKLLMEVETAVMHDKHFYPLTLQSAEKDIPLWINEKNNGFDIVTFEVSGKVTIPSDEKSSVRPKQLEGSYVACSPFTLESIVEVPEHCIMRIDDISGYKPGLLRMSSLLWQMKDYIVKGKTLILTDQTGFSGKVLQMMLSKPLKSQTIITNFDSLLHSNNRKFKVDTVVILTAADIAALDGLLLKANGVQTILSFNMFVTRSDWKSAKKNHETISFRMFKSEKMLSRKVLGENVPGVVRWLRKNLPKIACNGNETPISAGTILDLQELKQRNKRVKVEKQQLFRRSGCYIIIGGLTGLGWEICKYIARSGAGGIITLSRSRPNTKKLEEINTLEQITSTTIKAISADITDVKALLSAFDQIESQFPMQDVRGIFHGGAVLSDAWFTNQTDAAFRKVLLPKILGSWNLHVVSKRYNLDFFILHSSIASILGNKGQSNYSAGNAFMDSLAHYRSAKGLPGLSINWGPLSIGLATNNEEYLKKNGFLFLDVTKTIDTLEAMLMSEGSQIAAAVIKWSSIESQFTGEVLEKSRKRLKKLTGNTEVGNTTENIGNYDLDSTEGINSFVIQVASQLFAVDADMIGKSTLVSQLGIDSMIAMTFVNTIKERTGCTFPIVSLFSDVTTVGDIVNFLQNNMKKRDLNYSEMQSSTIQNVTYMEKHFLNYVGKPVPLSLFMYVDLEVSGRLSNIKLWETNLKHLIQKHPSMRTRFHSRMDDEANQIYTRILLPQEEVVPDVRKVPRGTINRTDSIPSDLEMYTFDPAAELPLRLLYECIDEGLFIRLVFSHLTFDMTSVMLTIEEIQNFKENSGIPLTVSTAYDIVSLVDSRLHNLHDSLTAYWKENIPVSIAPLSFSSSNVDLDTEYVSTISLQIPEQLLAKLSQYVHSNKMTSFQMIVTAYQLLLGLELCAETITVLTVSNIRMHFPQLQKEIGCLVNNVPLFFTIIQDTPLQNILTENVKHIQSAIKNSLYPLELIKAEVAQRVDPASVFRHQVNFRDLNIKEEYTDERGGIAKVLKAVALNTEYETVLVVWNDRRNLALRMELQYTTLTIDNSKASLLLHKLIRILDFLVDNPGSSVQEMAKTIQTEGNLLKLFDPKSGLTSEEQAIISGQFIKLTRKGWNHQVQMSVCRREEEGHTQTLLKWKKPYSKHSREIKSVDIVRVEKTLCNGLGTLMVRTKKRLYTFMTQDKRLCQEMSDCLEAELYQIAN